MTRWLRLLGGIALWAGASGAATGQGTQADYERAANLRAGTQGKVFRAQVHPHWLADNRRFWYRNDLPGGAREFILVSADKGVRAPAFDHTRLAAALGKATGTPQRADRLDIDRLDFADA